MGDGGFMDVMDRRTIMGRVLAGMASGAQFVKGTFTVPNDANTYELSIGKTFEKYLFLVEADDNSKRTIISSGYDASKCYGILGIYPKFEINNVSAAFNMVHARINPSTSANALGSSNITNTSTAITLNCADLSAAYPNGIYRGLTYNYYIVEIK